jgi:hypothetical protein
VSDVLNITIPSDLPANAVVELFDMNGRRVETGRAPSLHGDTITIDMSSFRSGNYILRIGNHTAKILKQ